MRIGKRNRNANVDRVGSLQISESAAKESAGEKAGTGEAVSANRLALPGARRPPR